MLVKLIKNGLRVIKMPNPWKFHGLMLYVLGFIAVGILASYIMDWILK
jgi:hypothetical protein